MQLKTKGKNQSYFFEKVARTKPENELNYIDDIYACKISQDSAFTEKEKKAIRRPTCIQASSRSAEGAIPDRHQRAKRLLPLTNLQFWCILQSEKDQ
jgi:hypothetical protein